MNFRKAFANRSKTKALFLTMLFALIATTAAGLAFLPDFYSPSQAAREKISQNPTDELASPEMLKNALNFKSAAGFQTLAAKSDAVNSKTAKELSETFSALIQLPCTNVPDAQIGGKSFAPGVY